MDGLEFINKAVKIVEICEWRRNAPSVSDVPEKEPIYVVWSVKVLQNNKALLSGGGDTPYYEVTYDGDRDMFYVNYFSDQVNQAFKGEEIK